MSKQGGENVETGGGKCRNLIFVNVVKYLFSITYNDVAKIFNSLYII